MVGAILPDRTVEADQMVRPGLGDRLTVEAEEAFQVDDVLALGIEVEADTQ